MALYGNMNISQSGLAASRQRLEAASSNLANAETAASTPGAVYQPLRVVQSAQSQAEDLTQPFSSGVPQGRGVLSQVTAMPGRVRAEFDPDHPDADDQGYVYYPDLDVTEEVSEMMAARRAYQIGLTAYGEAKQMFHSTLDILRGA